MSKTPVLTKKQQKSSLSAKKTKTKETVRNVLASPYSKYWPLVSKEDCLKLRNILNKNLPKLLPDKVKIPWKEIRKVPKSERKQFRDQYTLKHFGPDYLSANIEKRDGIILGINDVTKSLENEEAKSILITEDIVPRLMVEHVIDQAVLVRTPVLVVPELRKLLKEKCGISSGAIAFSDCQRYKLVQANIKDVSKKYPIPENHINFDRAQKVTDDSVVLVEDSFKEDILQDTEKCGMSNSAIAFSDCQRDKLVQANIKDVSKIYPIPKNHINFERAQKVTDDSVILVEDSFKEDILQDTSGCEKDKLADEKDFEQSIEADIEPVENVHLIRTSNDKRVFVPKKSSDEFIKDQLDVDSSGFISFSADTPSPQQTETRYASLKVLRIKGDANRTKRKIQALKERKSKQKGNKKSKRKDTLR